MTTGELTALVRRAPGRLRTIEAAMTTWTDHQLLPAVYERLARVAGRPVRAPVDLDATASAGERPRAIRLDPTPGPPPRPLRPTAQLGDEATATLGPPPPPLRPTSQLGDEATATLGSAVDESLSYVLVELPDRWRVVGRGHVAASDGYQSWVGTGSLVTERDSARAAIHDAGPIGACLYPGPLLGWLELGRADADEIEGRPCWVVDAAPRPRGQRHAVADAARRPGSRPPGEFVGVEHRFWFDAATGIVLRHAGSIDGEPCSATGLTDIVVDQPIADDEFAPPPEAIVRSSHELLRDHLTQMGVDPDSLDLDDPVQVRRALRQGFADGPGSVPPRA